MTQRRATTARFDSALGAGRGLGSPGRADWLVQELATAALAFSQHKAYPGLVFASRVGVAHGFHPELLLRDIGSMRDPRHGEPMVFLTVSDHEWLAANAPEALQEGLTLPDGRPNPQQIVAFRFTQASGSQTMTTVDTLLGRKLGDLKFPDSAYSRFVFCAQPFRDAVLDAGIADRETVLTNVAGLCTDEHRDLLAELTDPQPLEALRRRYQGRRTAEAWDALIYYGLLDPHGDAVAVNDDGRWLLAHLNSRQS